MPKGAPSKQTIASAKYQKKAGYITKAFKIKKDVADEFMEACTIAGVSQAGKITELMLQFAAKTKENAKNKS